MCVLGLALAACASRPTPSFQQPPSSAAPRLAFTVAAPATPPASLPRLPQERAPFVEGVLAGNPSLAAAHARLAAAEAAIGTARKLPEPEVGAGLFALPIETRNGPLQGRIGVVQPLPQAGRRDALEEVARAEAQARRVELEAARASARLAAEELWLDLVELAATLTVKRANLASFQGSAEVARGRFKNNLTGSAELLAIEEAIARLEDEIANQEARYPVLWARMAALLGFEGGHDLAGGPRPDMGDLPSFGIGAAADWRAALEHGTWASAQLAAREAAAGARIEVAEASNEPSFKLGVEYTFVGDDAPGPDAGNDALAFSFGMRVPLWRRADASAVDAERALLRAARFEHAAQTAADRARLEELLAAHDEHARHLDLFVTRVIPQAEQTLAAEERAYASGSGSYLELVRLQRRLFDDQLETQRAMIAMARVRVRLDNLLPNAGTPEDL